MFTPGVVGILLLLGSVLWMVRHPQDRSRLVLVFAMFGNLFYGWLLTALMGAADGFLPSKFDHYLYLIDSALGLSAASVAKVFGSGLSWSILSIAYQLMVPMMILWWWVAGRKSEFSILLAYSAEMLVGPCCYILLPACGPVYAFGRAWLDSPAADLSPVRMSGIPNAVPSLHFSTALVLVLLSKDRFWRAVSVVFLIATALATLTTGEHYFIDLIIAVPFARFAVAVAYRQIGAAAFYIGVVVVWILGIRTSSAVLLMHPSLLRGSVILTLGSGMYGLTRLWRDRVPAGQLAPIAEHPRGQITIGTIT